MPQAYKTNFINLTNHKGEVRDIQFLIPKMIIRESLFSPTLVLELTVLDTYNFFETFQMIGQEEIHVNLSRSEPISEDEYGPSQVVDLYFIVVDYPMYTKNKANSQAYTISALSSQSFFSGLKKISYPITGKQTTAEEIKKIMEDELGTPVTIRGEASSTMKGIINYQEPLSAAGWLLEMTYDDLGSPFYLHQTLSGDVYLDSNSVLVSSDVYGEYETRELLAGEKYSFGEYVQMKTSLIDIASELRLSKYFSAVNGAYSSQIKYIDIASKTLGTERYSYDESFSLTGKPNLSRFKKYPVEDDPISLDKAYTSFVSYYPKNSLSFGSSVKNYNGLAEGIVGTKVSREENFNYLGHHITVCGDFNLNAGKKISIKVPKAINLQEQIKDETLEGRSTDDIFDQNISGSYIVTSVEHIFESTYTCVALINKDSPNFKL